MTTSLYKRVAICSPQGVWSWYGPVVAITSGAAGASTLGYLYLGQCTLDTLANAALLISSQYHGQMGVCVGATAEELSDARLLESITALRGYGQEQAKGG